MRWERWRIAAMLAPTVIVIVGLFGGGLVYSLPQSFCWQPLLGMGNTHLGLHGYASILISARYADGLGLSLWASLASTTISAGLAVGAALLIRRTSWSRKLALFLFQFNLPIPHIVAAIGVLFLLSQSGLLSRLGAQIA